MKKFGVKKDQAGDNDDANRSALFGRRNPKLSNAPSKNPYADNAAPADPYARGNQDSGYGKPPSYDERGPTDGDKYRQEKTPVPPGGYGGGRDAPRERGGYGSSSNYAAQRGYGGDQYGGDSQPPARRGGYGGMGKDNSRDTISTDAGRNELFGSAAQRYEQRQQRGGYGDGQQSGISGDGGYGSYQDRELTAEEAEEEDIRATKDQIRYIKQQDVASTRNMLRIAQQAEETGRDTLARLGAQGERIHNTEKNLDLASNQNRIAEEKAKELKTLNRSMFAVHVKNPFTAGKRQEEFEQRIMETHQRERDQRDATRAAAYSSQARADQFGREARSQQEQGAPMSRSSAAERAKYQFEADSEDEEMENEIEDNLNIAHQAVGRMKHVAQAMGREVDSQNEHIRRIIGKTDKVDDQIAMNRARLDQFK